MSFVDFFREPNNVLAIFLTVLAINTIITVILFLKKQRADAEEAKKNSKITRITSLKEFDNLIIEKDSVWFVDIDETIVYPTSTAFIKSEGHPKVENFINHLEKTVPKPVFDDFIAKTTQDYYISYDLVEGQTTLEFLERLFKHSKAVHAITARKPNDPHSKQLLEKLEKFGVLKFLTNQVPSTASLGDDFAKGVFFTSHTNKGEYLAKILKECFAKSLVKDSVNSGIKVYLIEDSFGNIKQTSEALLREKFLNHELIHYKYVERKRISYKGMLYQFSDYFSENIVKKTK